MILIYSSHGELAVASTGVVLARERYNPADPESEFIDNILLFDVADFSGQTAYDILDVGWWYRNDRSVSYESRTDLDTLRDDAPMSAVARQEI